MSLAACASPSAGGFLQGSMDVPTRRSDMKLTRATLVVSVLVLGGCLTGPKPVQFSPRMYLHQNQPKQLWLTLKDGSKMTMVGPRVIDDTLFGWTEGANEDLTVAITDIKSLEARRIDPIRTAIIPTVFLGAGIMVFTMVKGARGAEDVGPCPDGDCTGYDGEQGSP